jgi:murein DD-endopeptidase MepM/ murein hydrolase activator NlpD
VKDSIAISVSTIRGTQQYCLGKTLKAFYILLLKAFVVILLLIGVWIHQLSNEIMDANLKHSELKKHSNWLFGQLELLEAEKARLGNDLSEKEERLTLVVDRMEDIERTLDLDWSQDEIESRLDTAAITSSIRESLLTQIPNGSPVLNARLSSAFGYRIHPVTNTRKFHRGQDFAINIGTHVYATADGIVEVIRPSRKGSGNFVRLIHAHGFTTSYSHLSEFRVKNGDYVQKGDLIALSGNSGLSSGPHLHYEVRFLGKALDPIHFIEWNINEFETVFLNNKEIKWESLINIVEHRVSNQLRLSSHKAVDFQEN